MSNDLNVYSYDGEDVVVHMDGKKARMFFTKGKNGVLYVTVTNEDRTLGATIPLVAQACVLDVIGAGLNVG